MGTPEFAAFLRSLRSFQGCLALVGTGKNAGKTTVLNFLLGELPAGETAVTSIGRDGERLDVVEKLPKPAIFLEAGTLFATAEECLKRCQGGWTVMAERLAHTPLGQILIARARERCRVELAGPSQVAGLILVRDRMMELGASRVLIDGAFDRAAGSTARLADAVLLAAGSAGRSTVDEAAGEIQSFVKRFHLPLWTGVSTAGQEPVSVSALTNSLLEELSGSAAVIPDPSCCLIDASAWRWIDSGRVQVFVQRQIPLLAVLVSPFRPHLPPLDAAQLLARVRQLCQNVPAFDLKQEGFFRSTC